MRVALCVIVLLAATVSARSPHSTTTTPAPTSSGYACSCLTSTNAPSSSCGDVPGGDVFSVANYSSCTLVHQCETQLCSCSCANINSGVNCSGATSCMQDFFQCLGNITDSRTNTSDAPCATFGSQVYQLQQDAATSQSLSDSVLYQSCAYATCQLANIYGLATQCTDVTGSVCTADILHPAPAPPTTAAPVTNPNPNPPAAITTTNSSAVGAAGLGAAATIVVALVMLS